MKNIIKVNINIPYFLQEIEVNIASLKQLSDFNSRFCLLLAYKNELEDLPPIIELQDFFKKYFNLDSKMHIFIEDSFKEIFKSKTITFKFNNYEDIKNIWEINFNELVLNKKIKEKIKNEEYFSLTENLQKRKKIFLREILNNKSPKEVESKIGYEKIENNNETLDSQVNRYLDQNYYETLGETNVKIDHLSQEIQSIELLDSYLTYIDKEHEFIVDESKNLLAKNRRTEKLIEHIKIGLIEKEDLKETIKKKYNLTLKENKFKEKLNSEVIYPEYDNYEIYLENILEENIGIESDLCIYENNTYLVNPYKDKLFIPDLKEEIELTSFFIQKFETKYFKFIDLQLVKNEKLIKILLEWFESKEDYTNLEINFIKNNINLISISEVWTEKLIKYILEDDEIKEMVHTNLIELNENVIKLITNNTDISYEELYLIKKWEYKNKEIFSNWNKEINFWKLIKMKEQFDVSPKENFTLEDLKFFKNKVENIEISPIKDIRIDNFYKELNKQIEANKMPIEDKFTVRIVNLRKKFEDKIGVTKKKSFSKQLGSNYEEDEAYLFYKNSYKFLSEHVHGRKELQNEENLKELEHIEKTIDLVNLKKKV